MVNEIRHQLREGSDQSITVDLERLAVTVPGGNQYAFTIDSFWRDCLLAGVDDLELTLSHASDIQAFELAYYAEMPWARVPVVA